MRKIFMCPTCNSIFSNDQTEPAQCPDCHVLTIPLNITKSEWEAMTPEQKVSIKGGNVSTSVLAAPAAKATPRDEDSDSLNAIQADIHTIKNILVFYLVVTIIGAVIAAVALLL